MTFRDCLKSHRGGLIRLKNQLFWYGGRGYDGKPGQVCLLLDSSDEHPFNSAAATAVRSSSTAATPLAHLGDEVLAHLLIGGSPQWIWLAREDVELL